MLKIYNETPSEYIKDFNDDLGKATNLPHIQRLIH